MSLAAKLRFPARTASFVGVTFGMYGMLEVETALASDAERLPVLDKWVGRYGRALLRLYGVEATAAGPHVGAGVRHPGCDARGRGRMFVMNHRSGLDIALTLAFFEATIVSRADLARWPVIGMAARRVGTLFVDRADKTSGAAVITRMSTALDAGRGVMVYPEGTTFADDTVRPLRPGAFLAARRSAAELVPVGLAYGGADSAFVEEPFLDHMKRVSGAVGTKVAIEVGEPVPDPGGSAQAWQETTRAAMQVLVDRARRRL